MAEYNQSVLTAHCHMQILYDMGCNLNFIMWLLHTNVAAIV